MPLLGEHAFAAALEEYAEAVLFRHWLAQGSVIFALARFFH
jgi:hypothetical protein